MPECHKSRKWGKNPGFLDEIGPFLVDYGKNLQFSARNVKIFSFFGRYIFQLFRSLEVTGRYISQLLEALKVTGHYIFQLLETLKITAVSFKKYHYESGIPQPAGTFQFFVFH